MSDLSLLIVGLFLPLFPLSMVFNRVFNGVRQPVLRVALLLIWPHLGLLLIGALGLAVPGWVASWGLATAAFYAFRALAVREAGIWAGFMATSAWALLWVPVLADTSDLTLRYEALGFSAPLVLLALLIATLEDRFGAAFTNLYGGLGRTMPRFAGVLAVVVLAVIATPLFPGFFTLLTTIVTATPAMALALAGIWLLWSWAGARLLQGLIVGPPAHEPVADIGAGAAWLYVAVLAGLGVAGASLSGGLV
jgi:hypothetical protein